MKIKRSKKMERKILDKIKAHLNRAPRSKDNWHVSDLLYPRKSYWQRKDPQPMTDLQALYFTAGRAHHEVVEAMLGPKYKWKYGDLRYAAGLIEGEGHFGVSSVSGAPFLQVKNTKQSLLRWLEKVFGGNVSQEKKPTKGNQAYYAWTMHSAEAADMVEAIKPFLVAKLGQAETWLSLKKMMPGKGRYLSEEEKLLQKKLIEKLKLSRNEDSNNLIPGKRADAGEFKKHGIYYSPDLRVPYPIEFKTSRSEYEPKNLEKGFEGYLKQLAKYQACMDEGRGGLLVFFLGLKEGFRKRPALHFYQVTMTKKELAEETANIKAISGSLNTAVKTGKHDKLELCPAWMCNDCPWLQKCKPWLQDSKRKGLKVNESERDG